MTRPQVVPGSGKTTLPPTVDEIVAKHQQIYEITTENMRTIERIYTALVGYTHPAMSRPTAEKSAEPGGILPRMKQILTITIGNAEDSAKVLADLEGIIFGSTPDSVIRKNPCAG